MSTITISTDALGEVADRISVFCSNDQGRLATDHLIIEPSEEGLRWSATDRFRLGSLHRGSGDIESPVLLQPTLVDFARRAAARLGLSEVTFEIDEEGRQVVLALPELRVPRPIPDVEPPDLDGVVDRVPERAPTVVRVSAEILRAAVHACITFGGADQDESGHPVALRTLEDGTLETRATWEDRPDTVAHLPVRADGPVCAVVNATYLVDLLEAAGEQEIALLVGAIDDPVRVRTGDGFRGLLMPITIGRVDFEQSIADFLGVERQDLVVGDDGSVPVTRAGVVIGAELRRADDPFGRGDLARFVASAAVDVVQTPELLAELNEINAHSLGTRVSLIGGEVVVVGEVFLGPADVGSIGRLLDEIAENVAHLGPLLMAVHGRCPGTRSSPPERRS